MNRFDLEEALCELGQLPSDIDTIMYAYADLPDPATEDEILNMLIGVKQLHETRYLKTWIIFEELIKNGTISNKGTGIYPEEKTVEGSPELTEQYQK